MSAPVHLTLLVRCFESMIYGVGGAQFLTNPNYISQIYELYRSLQVKNSHATAAILKAWGLVLARVQELAYYKLSAVTVLVKLVV